MIIIDRSGHLRDSQPAPYYDFVEPAHSSQLGRHGAWLVAHYERAVRDCSERQKLDTLLRGEVFSGWVVSVGRDGGYKPPLSGDGWELRQGEGGEEEKVHRTLRRGGSPGCVQGSG